MSTLYPDCYAVDLCPVCGEADELLPHYGEALCSPCRHEARAVEALAAAIQGDA